MEPHQECAYDHVIMYDGHTTEDQILGRLLYKIINLYSDRRRLNEIFNLEDCKYIKKNLEIPSYFTHSYNDKKTIEWISKLNPNVVVVHTEGWVG